ncbi:MAG: hypothetical protein AAB929_06085 [Patescibacteria group bacterium]
MITDVDIKKLSKVFITKKDLKNALDPYSTRKELENTTIELIKYIGEVKTELKNDILSFKDQILFEINKLRDDITVTTGYRDMIQDHEARIETLEAKN